MNMVGFKANMITDTDLSKIIIRNEDMDEVEFVVRGDISSISSWKELFPLLHVGDQTCGGWQEYLEGYATASYTLDNDSTVIAVIKDDQLILLVTAYNAEAQRNCNLQASYRILYQTDNIYNVEAVAFQFFTGGIVLFNHKNTELLDNEVRLVVD